jgi:hypothetical protein
MTAMFTARPVNLESEARDHGDLNARLAQLFDLREHGTATRALVEKFIRNCFAQMHGATIHHFMPRLLSLHAGRGDMVAAFGLREAAGSDLFLESYFDRPIEEVLQTRLGQDVQRGDVIEVGHLSVCYPGAARWLIVALTALLRQAGYRWVVFTGTATLRNGFHRLGLRPVQLGVAAVQHLPPAERADWGRYYESSPVVMAGDIAHGYRTLLLQHELFQTLRPGIGAVDGASTA